MIRYENSLPASGFLRNKVRPMTTVRSGHTFGHTVPEATINKGKNASATDQTSDERRLYNLKEAAAYLHLSYWTVRDYVEAGVLPAVKLPCAQRRAKGGAIVRKPGDASARRILIDRRDLDSLIEECKEPYADKN